MLCDLYARSLDNFPLDTLDNVRTGDYVTNENYVISFVNISSIKTLHGGEYRCRASSEVAVVENAAMVKVFGPPIVRSMQNMTVVAGTDVVIKCPVGGWPIEAIFWEKSK